jgi:hypothetical protein
VLTRFHAGRHDRRHVSPAYEPRARRHGAR